MNVNPLINKLEKNKQEIILKLIEKIKQNGDKIFETDKSLIQDVLNLSTEEAIPALIEILNINETGKHEPCTAFAMILKFAKKEPQIALKLLNEALIKKQAPQYYLNELIEKTKVK